MKKKQLLFMTVFCSLFLLIYACRRDIKHMMNNDAVEDPSLEAAKIFYATYGGQPYTVNGQTYLLKPSWKNAWTVNENTFSLIVVPTDDAASENRDITVRRVVVFLKQGNLISKGKIVEFVGDKYDVNTNLNNLILHISQSKIPGFNGSILQYDLNYYPTLSMVYENGLRVPKIAGFNIVSTKNGKIQMSSPLITQNKNVNSLENGFSINQYKNITAGYPCIGCPALQDLSTNCDHVFELIVPTDNYGAPIADQPPYFIYVKDINCKMVSSGGNSGHSSSNNTNIGANSPFGGWPVTYTSGNISATAAIALALLKANFPCAAQIIQDMIDNKPDYGTMLHGFMGQGTPTQTWQSGALNFHTQLPNGTYGTQLGKTWSAAGTRSVTTTLNSSMLQNSSKLLITATIIHESIHGAIHYYLTNSYMNIQDARVDGDGSWIFEMPAYIELISWNQEGLSHDIMLTNYFDQAVSLLKQEMPGFTDKEYAMATLFGTNNPGANATAAQVQALQVLYSSLLTKYNITDQNMIDFGTVNLNAPAASKLGIGCP